MPDASPFLVEKIKVAGEAGRGRAKWAVEEQNWRGGRMGQGGYSRDEEFADQILLSGFTAV